MKILNIGLAPQLNPKAIAPRQNKISAKQVTFAGSQSNFWDMPQKRKLKRLLGEAPHVLERHSLVHQRFLTPLNDLIASVINKNHSNTFGKDLAKILAPVVKSLDNIDHASRDEIVFLSAVKKPSGSRARNYLQTLAALAMDHIGPKYKAILDGKGDLDKVEQLSELHGIDVHDAVADFQHFSHRKEIDSLKNLIKTNA